MSETEIRRLADQCGDHFSTLIEDSFRALSDHPGSDAVSEREFVQDMQQRSGIISSYLDFSAAGVYDYYRPALLGTADKANDSVRGEGLEHLLGELCGLPQVLLSGQGLVGTLVRVLREIVGEGNSGMGDAKRILVPATLSPSLRQALSARLRIQGLDMQVLGFDGATGLIDEARLAALKASDFAAMIVPWPNYLGVLENIDSISAWAGQANVRLLGLVNAQVLAWLKSPAQLYPRAFDYLVGDCQALGFSPANALSAPCFIAADGEKNDCLGWCEGLRPPATADRAVLSTALAQGGVARLHRAGRLGRANLDSLVEKLLLNDAVSLAFASAPVNEVVLRVAGIDLVKGRKLLAGHNIVAGQALGDDFPELADCLLLHCNDRHRDKDIERFVNRFAAMVKNLSTAPCPVKPRFS